MKLTKLILRDQMLQIGFCFIILQQILVSGGTYLMGEISANATKGILSLNLLVLLIASLSISGSLLQYLISLYTAKAQKSILRSYFKKYIEITYNKPKHWRSQNDINERHQIMCREGQDTLTSTIYFFADVAATSFNIILNTIAVILVTNLTLGGAIVIAGVLGLVVIHFFDKKISNASELEIQSQNSLNGFLNRSWDNLVLGNQPFFARWLSRFSELFNQSEFNSVANIRSRDKAVAFAAFITTFTVVATSLSIIWINQKEATIVIPILIMLPRSLQIVMHVQVIQSLWAQWKYLRQRIHVTEITLAPFKDIDLENFIQPNKIGINQTSTKLTIEQFLKLATGLKPARYTISGANGAGKSTLLLKLKDLFGENAIYLPTHHTLELSEESETKSHGEKALLTLEEVQSLNATAILIDEWDANLSPENRKIISEKIDRLSTNHLVVEVRHHA